LSRAQGFCRAQSTAGEAGIEVWPTGQRNDENRNDCQMDDGEPNKHRGPIDLREQGGESGDYDELTDARSGDDCGVGKTGAGRECVGDDDANRREGGKAAANGEYNTVEQQRLPGLCNQAHEPDPKRANEYAGIQEKAWAHAVGETTGKVGCKCRDHQVCADSQSELAPVPAKLGHHGPEGEADGIAGTAANEEDDKSGGEDKSGMHRPTIRELGAPTLREAGERAACARGWQSTLPRRVAPRSRLLRSLASDDALRTQGCELLRAHAEPTCENVVRVLTEQRRRFDLWWRTVKAHRPGWHLDLTGGGMVDRLHDTALCKGRIVQEFQRVEYSSGRHASGTEQLHGFLFAVLSRPG